MLCRTIFFFFQKLWSLKAHNFTATLAVIPMALVYGVPSDPIFVRLFAPHTIIQEDKSGIDWRRSSYWHLLWMHIPKLCQLLLLWAHICNAQSIYCDIIEGHQVFDISCDHSCQNSDLNLTILRFYIFTCPKRFRSFKDLCDHLGLVG